MAKKYGQYKFSGDQIDRGGQGDILRVVDTLDPSESVYALKRLRNVSRISRFRQEIEALQRIAHPNVIKIINHSGDPLENDASHKYWFVMPIAHGGNLEGRKGLYKDNLDSVITVALQLAEALVAAHAMGIVHRDVKPANVLFSKLDHEVWLSDFGICHFGNEERYTEVGEVVGPKGFIAPELEPGGQLSVSAAADIYSLGKLIFYMLSGGGFIAREQIDTEAYLSVFADSERHRLLQTLLLKMIAPLDRRLKNMSDVREELLQIVHWEQHARALPLTPDAVAAIDLAQRKASERMLIHEKNARTREGQVQLKELVSKNILDWLRVEVEKTAVFLKLNDLFKTSVDKAIWTPNSTFSFGGGGSDRYVAIDGVELRFLDTTARFEQEIILKFFVCCPRKVTVYTGNSVKLEAPVDQEFAIIPYIAETSPVNDDRWIVGGYLYRQTVIAFSRQAELAKNRGVMHITADEPNLICRSFYNDETHLVIKFKASEWPAVKELANDLLAESVKTMIEYATSDTHRIGT